MRERADICLVGNHDLVVRGDLGVDAFTADAAEAASYARASSSPSDEREWLRTLAPLGQREGVELYHGSIRDPVWEYVLTAEIALACLNRQRSGPRARRPQPRRAGRALEHGELTGGLAAADSEYTLDGRHCLLNPGSVGQPRDRDPRAAWLLLDLEAQTAHFHRSEYDIARTQAEIRAAGLPERLADRLSSGVRLGQRRGRGLGDRRDRAPQHALLDEPGGRELAGLVDAPLGRGERDLQRLGDLVVREPDDVAQDERRLQVVGERSRSRGRPRPCPRRRRPARVRAGPAAACRCRPVSSRGGPARAARRARGSSRPGTATS